MRLAVPIGRFWLGLGGLALLLAAYLLVRLEEAPYRRVLKTAARYPAYEGRRALRRDDWETFNLYFLGFDDRWLISGWRPVKLRVMVYGYFDRAGKPRLVYTAGPAWYKGKELKVEYFGRDRRRWLFGDQEKFVSKMGGHVGDLVEVALYVKPPEGQGEQAALTFLLPAGIWPERFSTAILIGSSTRLCPAPAAVSAPVGRQRPPALTRSTAAPLAGWLTRRTHCCCFTVRAFSNSAWFQGWLGSRSRRKK